MDARPRQLLIALLSSCGFSRLYSTCKSTAVACTCRCMAVQLYRCTRTGWFLLPVLSYCTFRVSSKFLFPCSMRAFYTATRTTSLCAHMSAFPTKKPTPTPYFAHFLKEILRMRAHSREGNIKGNCPLGGGSFR